MAEVCEGDWVRDPMDGELRQVDYIIDTTLYLTDGGVMGKEEVNEVLLPSEVDLTI